MATDIQDQNFTLPVSWDGNRHSGTVPTLPAPSSLTANAVGSSINLTWVDNSGGLAETVIQKSLDGSTGWTELVAAAAGVEEYEDSPLAPDTYYYRAYARVGSTTSSNSSTASDTVTNGVTLLFSNGFETDLTGFSSPGGTAAYARVTNSPDSGTYCVRGNFIGNKYDSIANITGNGNTINLVVPDLRANTPDACVLRYRFRIDPANYAASSGGLNYIKSGYFSDTSSTANTVNAFWPAISHQTGAYRYIGRNSTWLNASLTGWPAGNIYFANNNGGAVNTFDGNYHTFEIRFNYIAETFRMFVDDLPIYGATYFTDGNFNMGAGFRFDQARIFYASGIDVNGSTDGVGIAGGWQIDNFEVYDGPA